MIDHYSKLGDSIVPGALKRKRVLSNILKKPNCKVEHGFIFDKPIPIEKFVRIKIYFAARSEEKSQLKKCGGGTYILSVYCHIQLIEYVFQ